MRTVNVKAYRIHEDRNVVVEIIVTLEADNDEEAITKAMAEIEGVLPHDELFGDGSWRWEDCSVEWLEWE